MGRFLTPDAVIPDWTSGQNWNQYAYVLNDPLTWVDPSGFERSWGEVIGDGWDELWDRTERGWDRVKHGVKQWWNESPCKCVPLDESPLNGDLVSKATGGVFGPTTMAVMSAAGKLPSGPQMLYHMQHVRVPPPSAVGRLGPAVRLYPVRQTWTSISPDYALQAPNVGTVGRLKPNGSLAKVMGKSLRWNPGGMAKLGFLSAVTSALGQGLSDALDQPCLTHGQRILNMLNAGAWGGVLALGGMAVTGLALTLGAPALVAGVLGFGFATALGQVKPVWKKWWPIYEQQ